VVITRVVPITSVKGFVVTSAGEALSLTWTVKLEVPEPVGVPLRTPAADKDRPAGSGPVPGTTRDHVYGLVPPVAARVCE
jgi:hypothetical protein